MSSFAWYLVGYIIFVVGLAWAAVMLGAQPMWVVIGVIVLIGIGIMMATRRKRHDPPAV
jgi:hypothetical protein